jgi:uncharacterized protein YbaP (TraB family)
MTPLNTQVSHSRRVSMVSAITCLCAITYPLESFGIATNNNLWIVSKGNQVFYLCGISHFANNVDYLDSYINLINKSSGVAIENAVPLSDLSRANEVTRRFDKNKINQIDLKGQSCLDQLKNAAPPSLNIKMLPLPAALLTIQSSLNLSPLPADSSASQERISVDNFIINQTIRKSLKIYEIEGANNLADFFVSINDSEILALLKSVCAMSKDPQRIIKRNQALKKLDDLYKRGLTDEFYAADKNLRFEILGWSESLITKFLDERNQVFFSRILNLSRTRGVNLFFVGMSHLGGSQGILQLLIKSDFNVQATDFIIN